MQPIAPGTVVFHRFRGYGVLTAVNLLSGWVSVRFGQEAHALDLCLSSDQLQHADGEPILFRRAWFAAIGDALLPDYAYSFGWEAPNACCAALEAP